MKIKLGVNFEIAYINTDPFQDDSKRADDAFTRNKIITWSTNPETCTKSNINTLIDRLYHKLKKIIEDGNVEGSGWIIYRWHYIFVECLTTKPLRASSYIPTPVKYTNAKCG